MTEELLPLAVTQASSHRKPKRQYHHPSSAAKIATPTTGFKDKTTLLMTDYMSKKVDKDAQLQELSRMPVVKTSNIAFEKFPYSTDKHQDTMAGLTSNFSESMELPDDGGGNKKHQNLKVNVYSKIRKIYIYI